MSWITHLAAPLARAWGQFWLWINDPLFAEFDVLHGSEDPDIEYEIMRFIPYF